MNTNADRSQALLFGRRAAVNDSSRQAWLAKRQVRLAIHAYENQQPELFFTALYRAVEHEDTSALTNFYAYLQCACHAGDTDQLANWLIDHPLLPLTSLQPILSDFTAALAEQRDQRVVSYNLLRLILARAEHDRDWIKELIEIVADQALDPAILSPLIQHAALGYIDADALAPVFAEFSRLSARNLSALGYDLSATTMLMIETVPVLKPLAERIKPFAPTLSIASSPAQQS